MQRISPSTPGRAEVSRLLLTAFAIAALAWPRSGPACAGSSGPVCTLNPAACLKTMVLAKAAPIVAVIPLPGAPPSVLTVPTTLFVSCPTVNNCGVACPLPATAVSATLTIKLYPAPCPPAPLRPPPTLSATLSTSGGSMPLPNCAPTGSGFNPYLVPVSVPAGTSPGVYCVIGEATVTFSDGVVLSQTGDTEVCLVEPAADQPGVPRLEMRLLSEPVPRRAPGDQTIARYVVTNHDPDESVALTAIANSRQSAVRPQGGNEATGVFAISGPYGDDFPIAFVIDSDLNSAGNAGDSCLPLPDHPYTQQPISRRLAPLRPGQSVEIAVSIRSYGQCASGSCSESTLRVEGTFFDGDLARACAGMALFVDASVPAEPCGAQVNDCNRNGVPDAEDIAQRTSADQNFNAMPDECEPFISVPFFAAVTPQEVMPGAPIDIRVAFNEVVPMERVWANGTPLVRTQAVGAVFWTGVIPADLRPGPQTVYFLGRDVERGMATHVAVYQVIGGGTETNRPPRLGAIADQTVHAGMKVEVGVTATDDRGPLRFELVDEIPEGATIDPGTGYVAWPTRWSDADRSVKFTVRVSDPGEPVLTDQLTFVVQVRDPLRVQALPGAEGATVLTWNSIPGTRYLVTTSPDLGGPAWFETAFVQAESDRTIWQEAAPAGLSERFYQVAAVQDPHCACIDMRFDCLKPDVDRASFTVKTVPGPADDKGPRAKSVDVQIPLSLRGVLDCEASEHDELKCEGTVEISLVRATWQFIRTNANVVNIGDPVVETPAANAKPWKTLTVQNDCNSQGQWIPLEVIYSASVPAGQDDKPPGLTLGNRKDVAEGSITLRGTVVFKVRWRCALANWSERTVTVVVDGRADAGGGGVERQGHFDRAASDFDGDGRNPDMDPYDPTR